MVFSGPRTARLPLRSLAIGVVLAGVFYLEWTRHYQRLATNPLLAQCPVTKLPESNNCRVEELIVTKTTTTTVHRLAETVTRTVTTTRVPVETPPNRKEDAFGFGILDSDDEPILGEGVEGVGKGDSLHFYRKDGLLEVNPDGPHPIFELMSKAEAKWKLKNKKASRTLKEACTEYQRRYGRRPPKGFDLWWLYVKTSAVRLPDEYDQIYRDVEHFWGIDPRHLQKTQHGWEAQADSFTLGKETLDDPISLLNFTFHDIKDKDRFLVFLPEMFKLLQDVQGSIPPFRAVFSPHDGPNLPTDHELMTMAVKAARDGKYIDVDHPPEVKLHGWPSSCAPDSPARVNAAGFPNPIPPLSILSRMKFNTSHSSPAVQIPGAALPKTFIHNHKLSMDPCLHPAHLLMHGQFISHQRGPVPHRQLIPQFSFSPSSVHHDIMVAYPHSWVEDIKPRSDDPPFDKKDDHRLQWRGSNTGMYYGSNAQWWRSQRPRVIDWANPRSTQEMSSTLLLRSTPDERWKVGNPVDLGISEENGFLSKAMWAPAMADVAFVGQPIGCDEGVCGRLSNEYEFRQRHSVNTQGKYKYIIDVDGNAWSSRFKRLMTSNSLIFKSTIYREWYADRIEPWLHFVPIQIDYSDLLDTLYFFRGDPSGHGGHPDLAKKIAEKGREWSLSHWRQADMTAYMFRLFLEYSRIMSTERENGGLDYVYDEDDEVNGGFDPEMFGDFSPDGAGTRRAASIPTFEEMLKRRKERRMRSI
ncbi:hypothetical protein FA15DRAFT_668662, partial [Coprinopsis marcescibilis]